MPADARPGSSNVGPDEIAARLAPRTSAILVAHIAGEPVDVGPILEFARERGIPQIEDCAQAHGALYRGPSWARDFIPLAVLAVEIRLLGDVAIDCGNLAAGRELLSDSLHRQRAMHARSGNPTRVLETLGTVSRLAAAEGDAPVGPPQDRLRSSHRAPGQHLCPDPVLTRARRASPRLRPHRARSSWAGGGGRERSQHHAGAGHLVCA